VRLMSGLALLWNPCKFDPSRNRKESVVFI
jgi:hypothetical protein